MSFPETQWIWKNGELIAWNDARIHIMSHVVHYGSSIFEGMRCYDTTEGPSIFRLDEHLRRFHDSARIYRMPLNWSVPELREACHAVVRANGLRECYIRPVAIRGYGAAGVNPKGSPLDTYIVVWPWGAYLGAGALENGVDACISSWARAAPNTFPALAKAGGNYVNSQLMKMEAEANGYAEAIGLGPDGLVSEGSGQNLFLVRDGVLFTSSTDGTQLNGITRDSVITLARALGIPVLERPIPRESLYTADELFFTGTAAELTPIRSVDRIQVGAGRAGPLTLQLQKEYLEIARGLAPDRFGWRSVVAMAPEEEGGRPAQASAGSAGSAGVADPAAASSPAGVAGTAGGAST